MVFFIILTIAVIFSIAENKYQRKYASIPFDLIPLKNRKVFNGALLVFLLMFLLTALRDVSVGVDTEHYYRSFNQGISRFVEIGYWLIHSISFQFDNSFQSFLILYAVVTFLPLFFILKRESSNISFSLLIYLSFSNFFYPETFNTIRATASISLFLLALSYSETKDYKSGLLLLITSFLFHNSAIVAFAITIIVIYISRLPQKFTYIIIIGSIIFGLTFNYGFSDYALLLSNELSNFSGDAAEYYSRYVNAFSENKFNIVGTLANMIPFSLFAFLLYDEFNSRNIYYKLFFVGTILANVFISVELVYRITMFFSLLLIFVLPNTICRMYGIKLFATKILIFFMLSWYLYKLFWSTSDNMAGILPYKFYFE